MESQRRCEQCQTILYKGSCIDCVPPQGVKAFLNGIFFKAACRAVARDITRTCIIDAQTTDMQLCTLAKHLDTLGREMPGVMLNLPAHFHVLHASLRQGTMMFKPQTYLSEMLFR